MKSKRHLRLQLRTSEWKWGEYETNCPKRVTEFKFEAANRFQTTPLYYNLLFLKLLIKNLYFTFDGEAEDHQKNLNIPHVEAWKEKDPKIPPSLNPNVGNIERVRVPVWGCGYV